MQATAVTQSTTPMSRPFFCEDLVVKIFQMTIFHLLIQEEPLSVNGEKIYINW